MNDLVAVRFSRKICAVLAQHRRAHTRYTSRSAQTQIRQKETLYTMQRKMIRNELNIYFYVNCNVFYLHKINEYK